MVYDCVTHIMYLYMYIYMYMYIYVYMCIYICIYIYVCTYTYTCICIYIYACIYIYMHAYINIYIYTHMHAYIHAYMHAYIHTYIHTYIKGFLKWGYPKSPWIAMLILYPHYCLLSSNKDNVIVYWIIMNDNYYHSTYPYTIHPKEQLGPARFVAAIPRPGDRCAWPVAMDGTVPGSSW